MAVLLTPAPEDAVVRHGRNLAFHFFEPRNTAVADINCTGTASGRAVGSSTISASFGTSHAM